MHTVLSGRALACRLKRRCARMHMHTQVRLATADDMPALHHLAGALPDFPGKSRLPPYGA